MGFTNSEWDTDGSLISTKMLTEAQALGENAVFTINGTTMTSTSRSKRCTKSERDTARMYHHHQCISIHKLNHCLK